MEGEVLAIGQRVADPQRAVIGNADHVAGIGFVRNGAVLREEELRRRQRHRSCRCAPAWPSCRAVSLPEHSRAKAMRSRWLGSMFAWILNTKADIRARRPRPCANSDLLRARRRRKTAEAFEQIADAEIAQRASRNRPASDGPRGTTAGRTAWQASFTSSSSSATVAGVEIGVAAGQIGNLDLLGGAASWRRRPLTGGCRRSRCHRCRHEIAAAADRPVDRRGVERQRLLDLVEQIEHDRGSRGPSC